MEQVCNVDYCCVWGAVKFLVKHTHAGLQGVLMLVVSVMLNYLTREKSPLAQTFASVQPSMCHVSALAMVSFEL